MPARRHLSHNDYTVAWICALPVEMAAAQALLDEVHEDLPAKPHDNNAYVLGRIGEHNVVIAGLPFADHSIVSGAIVITQLLGSFHAIRFTLVVGIGGGVPSEELDIRLGDIVVSKLDGGVILFDNIEAFANGCPPRVRMLDRLPEELLTALSKLQSFHLMKGSRVEEILGEIETRIGQNGQHFVRPNQGDRLFPADYSHVEAIVETCDSCDITKTVLRQPRDSSAPMIHYGLIASTDQMVEDSMLRDRLGQEFQVNCIESGAAGVIRASPCLVIRGISHYADSHKSHDWEGYAAAVAGAYAKELLAVVWPSRNHRNTRQAEHGSSVFVQVLTYLRNFLLLGSD